MQNEQFKIEIMTNREKIIEIITVSMNEQGISDYKLCKDLGIQRSVFSRFMRNVVDERNANKKPASIKAEYLINILFYLKIMQL